MKWRFYIIFLFLSLNCFSQIDSSEKANPDVSAVKALFSAALANDDIKNSTSQISKAITDAEKINYIPDTVFTGKLVKRANIYILSGQFEAGNIFCEFILRLAPKQKYWEASGHALYLKAIYHQQVGNTDSSFYVLYCARSYYKYAKDSLQITATNNLIEQAYELKGDAASALAFDKANGRSLGFLAIDKLVFYGVYLGVLLFCFIYNLFLYKFTRDKSYLHLAKCIFAFLIFVYTANNDFASQFSRNQLHFTLLEFLKSNVSYLGMFYFASFLLVFLENKKEELSKFFKFLRIYKKAIIVIVIVSNALIIMGAIKNRNYDMGYYLAFRGWFGLNTLIGLLCTFVVYGALFKNLIGKKIRMSYLFNGMVINALLLALSFYEAATQNRISHIPYPHAAGATVFLIFMTVAVADKINWFKKEKEDAQENALKNLERIVEERTHDLQQQKTVVEEKNKEITDSIIYAKRLQDANLSTEKTLEKFFPESFILFKPKDIVSGDFYWILHIDDPSKNKNIAVFAAADCTGHGVPGAFMSMLNGTLLNQTAYNPNINTPADALNFLNKELPKNLKSADATQDIKDGMDIAFCLIDFNKKTLKFSGANNPCWIIRNGELIELKATKQAITASEEYAKKIFTDQVFDLQTNDCVYVFTDGYADQFGGPKGKKFKYKTLSNLLLTHNEETLQRQGKILEETFLKWKGELEQVDDVCIIGVRI